MADERYIPPSEAFPDNSQLRRTLTAAASGRSGQSDLSEQISRDGLGAARKGDIADRFTAGAWEFTPEVTEVFDAHVSASVPYYGHIQRLITEMTDWLLPDNGCYVDIGASTATTLAAICERHPNRRFRAELYDEAETMLQKAKEKVASLNALVNFHVQRVGANYPMKHKSADLTTALFLLQFLKVSDRAAVLAEARRCSADSGALIIAEKIRPEHPLVAEIGMDVSHDFKAECGLDDTAIRSKARALRGVLIPQTMPHLLAEIGQAGWHHADVVYRWHQWVVVIAFAT